MQSLAKIEAAAASQAIVAGDAAPAARRQRAPAVPLADAPAAPLAGADFGFEGEDEEVGALEYDFQVAGEPHDEDLGDEGDAPPPPPPPPPAANHGPRFENAVMFRGKAFVNLYNGRGAARVHTGLSRQCASCGYARNLYNVESGLSEDIAVTRLLAWEAVCPGPHASREHKELGLPKNAGRLMCCFR